MFGSVKVAEWPPSGKELLTLLTICSLCIFSVCNFYYFPFWFEDGILVWVVLVPCHCLLDAFMQSVQVNLISRRDSL